MRQTNSRVWRLWGNEPIPEQFRRERSADAALENDGNRSQSNEMRIINEYLDHLDEMSEAAELHNTRPSQQDDQLPRNSHPLTGVARQLQLFREAVAESPDPWGTAAASSTTMGPPLRRPPASMGPPPENNLPAPYKAPPTYPPRKAPPPMPKNLPARQHNEHKWNKQKERL